MFKISRGLLWVAALALVAFGGVAEAEQKGLEDGEMQLVVGHFTCSQQLAIRQLDGRLFYRGTTGIMADTAGFGVSQIFQDTDSGCLDLTMQISGAAMKQSCTVGPVRLIGQATELNFSCVGTQGMVVGTMGTLNRTLLSFSP